MTRKELIEHLENTKEIIAQAQNATLTDYARYKAYICIEAAIEHIKENEEKEF